MFPRLMFGASHFQTTPNLIISFIFQVSYGLSLPLRIFVVVFFCSRFFVWVKILILYLVECNFTWIRCDNDSMTVDPRVMII